MSKANRALYAIRLNALKKAAPGGAVFRAANLGSEKALPKPKLVELCGELLSFSSFSSWNDSYDQTLAVLSLHHAQYQNQKTIC